MNGLYAELEMAHGLIMVYRDGEPTPYAYSNVRRRSGRVRLEQHGWAVAPDAEWELLLPNSFRLRLRSGPIDAPGKFG